MLQRLIQNYIPGDEFEIRYYVDPRKRGPGEVPKYPEGVRPVIQKIIDRMTDVKHTKFIDLWFGDTRKRVTFGESDADRTEEWITKTRKCDSWTEANDFGGFRVALSRETAVTPTKPDHVDRVMAKYRLSCNLDDEWRLDVSAVKRAELKTAQDVKKRIIACSHPMSEWAYWDYWEFEIEYTGDDVPMIDVRDIYARYELLAPHVNYEMLDYVRRAATLVAHPRMDSFAKISGRNTIARLLPKAVEPSLEHWTDELHFALPGMILRDKIDGRRELLIIQNGKFVAVNARSLDEWDEPQEEDTYVFDAEYYEPDDNWYVLHVLVFKGRNVTHMKDSERLQLLDKEGLPDIENINICPWTIVQNAQTDIESWWSRKTGYHRDGLLLATDESYWTQKCYKWKSAEESTLDMLVVKCPDWLEGKAPYVKTEPTDSLYLLNVGVSANYATKQQGIPMRRYFDMFGIDKLAQYVPQPFSPLDAPQVYVWNTDRADLHGYICEMLFSNDSKSWTLKRVRDDKPSILRGGTEIGNDIKTALDIWSKLSNPFPLKYLWAPPIDSSSPFMDLAPAVENIVLDMQEEEQFKTAITHMTPFVPFGAGSFARAELVPEETHFKDYRTRRVTVQQIPYTQIGKLTLPKDFIGGAQLVVTMDPELLAHVSCVGKAVSPGGRLLVICRSRGSPKDDSHPLVNKPTLLKDLERAGFTLLEDYGPPEAGAFDVANDRFTTWDIMSFRKENRGTGDMTVAEVHSENPHLVGNSDANFGFKFMRQKTKDIAALAAPRPICGSLDVNPVKGQILVDIEFLSNLANDAQVMYFGDHINALKIMFPNLKWIATDDASAQNVEAVVCHETYPQSVEVLERYEPHSALIDVCHEDMSSKVLKGKYMLIPFMPADSTTVAVQVGRNRELWNIIPEMFHKEMQMFHQVYRPSAFKYAQRPTHLDNCYDCRSQQYILSKYARAQKINMEEANARFVKAIEIQ